MKPGTHLLLLVGLLLLPGCAGYQLGSSNGLPAGTQSLEIAPITNETVEARLIAPLTTSLRRRVQQDGTYRLATREAGDILLTTRITTYLRRELSVQPGDVVTVRDYLLTMTAHATAIDRATGRTLMDRSVAGRTTVRVENDLVSSERQAMPLLVEDLSRNLIGLLADGDF